MFFTLEDYKKIYEWISRNSISDTEFNEALTPLDETDTITLVLNGVNVRISLKDLIDQLFLMGVSDFLNITDKFGEKNITLDLAIELIPYKSRKVGQVITFLNNDNKWKVYLFKGELTQWDLLNLWEDILDIEAHTINSILPDEEDLTKTLPDDRGNSYLSFKDREYNPDDFSGLGRIILRKNIVEIEDPIYGKVKKNILYQDMITLSDTIYEIRYDFDLNGLAVTIPNNCILKFIGGKLNNGILIISNNNNFTGSNFLNNIKILGLHYSIYSTWFLLKSLKNIFDSITDLKFNTIFINDDLQDSSTIEIDNNNFSIIGYGNTITTTDLSTFCIFTAKNTNISIKNLNFINSNYVLLFLELSDLGIITNIEIDNCTFTGSKNVYNPILAYALEYKRFIIKNCTFISTGYDKTTTFSSNAISTLCNIPDNTSNIGNIVIQNNYFYNFYTSYRWYSSSGVNGFKFINNTVSDCYFGIWCYHCSNSLILNNTFTNCIENYLWQDAICISNIFKGGEHIILEAWSGIFANNTVRDMTKEAIKLSSLAYGKICNNLIIKCSGNGISYIQDYYSPSTIGFIENNTFCDIQGNGIIFKSGTVYSIYIQNNIFCNIGNTEDKKVITLSSDMEVKDYIFIIRNTFNKIYRYSSFTSNIKYFIDITSIEGGCIINNNYFAGTGNIRSSAIYNNYIQSNTFLSESDIECNAGINKQINFNIYNSKPISGSSSNRPSILDVGYIYFDTTINKPIYWTGTKWVDATGADV